MSASSDDYIFMTAMVKEGSGWCVSNGYVCWSVSETQQHLIWPLASAHLCRNVLAVAEGHAEGHPGVVLLVHPPALPHEHVYQTGP